MIRRSLLVIFALVSLMLPTSSSYAKNQRVVWQVFPVDEEHEKEISLVHGEIKPRMEDKSSDYEIYVIARTLVEECRLYGIDPLFVIALIQTESDFDVEAVSPTGARGLMQIIPSTFRAMSSAARMFDPVENVRAGIKYLRHLYDKGFGKKNNPEKLLLAYNQGPRVALESSATEHPEEAKRYIPRVMSEYRNLLKKHGFNPGQAKKLFIRETNSVNISQ